ncbi:MAG: flavodoxin family protein [Syntrophobacteraceae bacterium]|jgi:multimeric flavodoxin WrbA
MKIVCLLGSPRENGNSATIANRFCDTAERLGAEVQTFVLNKLEYRGCQGCMACKTKLDRCALEDDLTEVLDAVCETDVLVLASPVYYGDVSSQLKAFIDRTYSYLASDYLTNPKPCRLAEGKKLVFILTQGNPDQERFAGIFERYDYFFRWYGFTDSHLIRACGVRGLGEVAAHENVMRLAETMAEKICS